MIFFLVIMSVVYLECTRKPGDVAKGHPDASQEQDERESSEGGVPDLAGVAAPDSCLEVDGSVGERERHIRDIFAQEFTQWLPAVADVVLEETVLWDEFSHKVVMSTKDFLAAVFEVALEESIP